MIADLLTMDHKAFKEKWKIKRQIISHLKSDPLYKSRIPGNTHPKKVVKENPIRRTRGSSPSIEQVAEALRRSNNGQLPPFPEFNDSWSFMVQEKWLEVYQVLKGLEPGVKQ